MTTNDVLAIVAEYLNGNESAAIPLADMFEEADMFDIAKNLREKNVSFYAMVVDVVADLHGMTRAEAYAELRKDVKTYSYRTKIELMAANRSMHRLEREELSEHTLYTDYKEDNLVRHACKCYEILFDDLEGDEEPLPPKSREEFLLEIRDLLAAQKRKGKELTTEGGN